MPILNGLISSLPPKNHFLTSWRFGLLYNVERLKPAYYALLIKLSVRLKRYVRHLSSLIVALAISTAAETASSRLSGRMDTVPETTMMMCSLVAVGFCSSHYTTLRRCALIKPTLLHAPIAIVRLCKITIDP